MGGGIVVLLDEMVGQEVDGVELAPVGGGATGGTGRAFQGGLRELSKAFEYPFGDPTPHPVSLSSSSGRSDR